MSTRLKEAGFLKLKDIEIDLKQMNIQTDNVHFLQMNPENPDSKKINKCDLILIDGYAIKKGSMKEVLKNIVQLASNNSIILVLNVSGVNEVGNE
jgi:ketopantoate reductase